MERREEKSWPPKKNSKSTAFLCRSEADTGYNWAIFGCCLLINLMKVRIVDCWKLVSLCWEWEDIRCEVRCQVSGGVKPGPSVVCGHRIMLIRVMLVNWYNHRVIHKHHHFHIQPQQASTGFYWFRVFWPTSAVNFYHQIFENLFAICFSCSLKSAFLSW